MLYAPRTAKSPTKFLLTGQSRPRGESNPYWYSAHMFDPAAGSNSALLITEQLLVFAVFVGSVAALPAFIEFVTEVRKRKERIDLSLEDEVASSLRPRVAGMDDLLNNIADLIDRARNPSAYQDLKIGNEVLIIGPNQTGKKSLAQKIAQLAGMDRVVTVFNPRDSDALAKAKDERSCSCCPGSTWLISREILKCSPSSMR